MASLNREKNWDFDAGLLPLDFTNTAEWHARSDPIENLNSYADLVSWSWKAGLLTEKAAQSLLETAERRPQDARRALDRVIELREALYRIFSHSAAGTQIPNEDLASFNAALGEALHRVRLDASRDGFSWGWSDDNQNLEAMLWPILWKSAELLTSEDLKRVGECADDRGCGYLFYDNSRNHSRRWCSMESCGNRAKVQRQYTRSKTQDGSADGG
ncbi:MAG: ABATE domain-containing protein [Anaerolineales bacterium]